MKIVSSKNTILTLAAILTVAYGYMAISLSRKQIAQQKQSASSKQRVQEIENQPATGNSKSTENNLTETDSENTEHESQDAEDDLNNVSF
jgi:hypothetical protein